MQCEVAIIAQTQIHFDLLCGLTHTATGEHLAAGIDGSSKQGTPINRFVGCLQRFSPLDTDAIKRHVTITVLTALETDQALAVLEHLDGAPFLYQGTKHADLSLIVVTLTLAAWHARLAAGTDLPYVGAWLEKVKQRFRESQIDERYDTLYLTSP